MKQKKKRLGNVPNTNYFWAFFLPILESHDIMEIPTNKVTQMIIRAMQSCEKINGPSDESFQANLLSGYPRCKKDISDYMAKVIQERFKHQRSFA